MTGSDTLLLGSLAAGASGAIVASANVCGLAVRAYECWLEGRVEDAIAHEATVRAVVNACRVGSYPAGWKAALAALGVCGPAMVPPRSALPTAQAEALAKRLAELGVS